MAKINHIVFDIGRVLIHWNKEIPYMRLIPDEAERHWFLDNVCTDDWNAEQDRGRSWSDAEDVLIAQHPEHEENIRAFRKYWHEMAPHQIPGTFQIMQRLIDEGKDVTMLTNFSEDTFITAKELYPLLGIPRGVTVSGEVKLIKPDAEIYHHHCNAFGLEAENTLFFDDSPPNIDTARRLGWQAELFTSSEQMELDLVAHGVYRTQGK